MSPRLLVSTLLFPLLLIGAGCKEPVAEPTSQSISIYTVHIVKSEGYSDEKVEAIPQKEIGVKELLQKLNVPFQTAVRGGTEVFTELDMVMTTLSKEWNIYINNTIPEYASLDELWVRASDDIELRYEERE